MLPRLIGYLCRCRLQGSAASPAKASCRPVKATTGAALNSEGSPASFAILIGRLILATATQTLHQWPLKWQRSVVHITKSYRYLPISSMPLCNKSLSCRLAARPKLGEICLGLWRSNTLSKMTRTSLALALPHETGHDLGGPHMIRVCPPETDIG
jgi:hypothetical protein